MFSENKYILSSTIGIHQLLELGPLLDLEEHLLTILGLNFQVQVVYWCLFSHLYIIFNIANYAKFHYDFILQNHSWNPLYRLNRFLVALFPLNPAKFNAPLLPTFCLSTEPTFLASTLPNSTPHWSNGLIPHNKLWIYIYQYPSINTLCSYKASNYPTLYGLASLANRIYKLLLSPGNTLCGANSGLIPSANTSWSVFPLANAST